ncbi:hypothetical protein DEJ15_02785 [Curtobacterium sp. MCJR17_043]|nr:hypothetical protein [Curtobacterium sp. MCJR17_043]WIB36165.1 hypothetical protein DEJ15_02785 [Curtobacterium sp. MCJR17_043]
MKKPARSLVCGIATVSMLSLGLSVAVAVPAQAAPSAPSWKDVQAAKDDQAEQQRTVDALTARMATLQDRVDRTGATVQEAGQTYALAASRQQQAKDTLDGLTAESERAKAAADESAGQVAALVVELSRSGGGDLSTSMLVDSRDVDDLLYQVGTMSHLSERSATVLERAQADRRTVDSLAAQQRQATKALTDATDATKDAFDAANDVAADAQSALQAGQEAQDEVLEQLAFLKGTTVATEQAYWSAKQAEQAEIELAAQAKRAAARPTRPGAARPAAETGADGAAAGGGNATGSTPSRNPANPSVPAPAAPKPAAPKPAAPKPAAPRPAAPAPQPAAPKPAPRSCARAGSGTQAREQSVEGRRRDRVRPRAARQAVLDGRRRAELVGLLGPRDDGLQLAGHRDRWPQRGLAIQLLRLDRPTRAAVAASARRHPVLLAHRYRCRRLPRLDLHGRRHDGRGREPPGRCGRAADLAAGRPAALRGAALRRGLTRADPEHCRGTRPTTNNAPRRNGARCALRGARPRRQ